MENKVLRLKLHQNKAHYRKEETINNKMTYPLPPYSTIIGSIHNACNYKEYKDMKISIQGKYQSMAREVYRDQAFLNSIMDDRGVLVKLNNPNFHNEGYKAIAKALKSQGNSFRNKVTIEIYDEYELDEYIRISGLRDYYIEKNAELKKQEKELKENIKKLKDLKKKEEKGSPEIKKIDCRIQQINNEIKKLKNDFEEEKNREYLNPISYYACLTTSIKSYEVLYDVDLVIHILSDEDTLNDIMYNVLNITSIGRSEDFVELIEAKYVDIYEDRETIRSMSILNNNIYLSTNLLDEKVITYYTYSKKVNEIPTRGTNYYINKDYTINNNKRVFNKIRVSYLNGIGVTESRIEKYNKEFDDLVYIDKDGYIMSLV